MEDKKQMDKLKECFKKTFHKKVDRVQWEHKYMMALTEIHNIEGIIGMRKPENLSLNSKKETGDKSE